MRAQRGILFMAEVPQAREHHGEAALAGRANTFRVSHGAARLNDRDHACIRRGKQPGSKREKRI